MPAKNLLENYYPQLAKWAAAQQPVQMAQRPAQPQQQAQVYPLANKPVTSPTSTLNLQPHPSQLMAPQPQVAAPAPTVQQKAAQEEEAQYIWAGIEDALRKEGADQDFIDGFKKEAFVVPALKMIGKGLGRAGGAIGTAVRKAAPHVGRGLEHGMWGSMLGSAFGPAGTAVGGLGGLAGGTLGYGKAGLLAAGGLGVGGYLGAKTLGGFSDSGNDITGNPASRNRALPFAPNKVTGGIGGALLGGLMANEMGMSGAGAFMMPILGGLAGYHHLPNLLDKWKDPYGYGANAISGGAASMNRSMPLND